MRAGIAILAFVPGVLVMVGCGDLPSGGRGEMCDSAGRCDPGLVCNRAWLCDYPAADGDGEAGDDECGSHASSACHEGDVYWFDECGNREEMKDECGEYGCLGLRCNPAPDLSCADGLCTDPATGLVWEQSPEDALFDYHDARAHCVRLALGGHTSWCPPSISQLRSLVRVCLPIATGGSCGVTDDCNIMDESERCWTEEFCSPAYCGTSRYWPAEMGGISGAYWSYTYMEQQWDYRWYLDFAEGVVSTAFDGTMKRVRCVLGTCQQEDEE